MVVTSLRTVFYQYDWYVLRQVALHEGDIAACMPVINTDKKRTKQKHKKPIKHQQ
jgi:hypothetical protein